MTLHRFGLANRGGSRSLLLLLAAGLLAGCGKGSFSARNKSEEGVMRFPLSSNAATLDPALMQDTYIWETLVNVYEGLVSYNEKNELVGCLAESWDVKDGGKTYVFHIRHGVKFQNGKELTAEDVKWTIERNTAKNFVSPTAATYLNDIVGVAEHSAGKTDSISGISAPDPYTLVIKIDAPKPFFLAKMTYPCAFPLPKGDVPASRPIRSPDEAIGTGPFKVTKFIADQVVEMEAFDGYWGGKPRLKKIVREVVKDSTVRLNEFRGGQAEAVLVDLHDLSGVENDPELKPYLKAYPYPFVNYIALDGKKYAPFANRDVRRAVAMAINRDKMIGDLLPGLPVARQILPPGIAGYDPKYLGIKYDPSAAKALLAKAGYPDGKGLPTLELSYAQEFQSLRVCSESVAEQLKENLGMQVSIRPMELKTMIDAMDHRKLQAYMLGWSADYLDPQDFLSLLMTTGAQQNDGEYSNPEFDRLCAQADVEQDPAKRTALYRRAEDIAVQDVAWVPLFFQTLPYLVSANTSGWRCNEFGPMAQLYTEVK